jgi:putative flippase GtrA
VTSDPATSATSVVSRRRVPTVLEVIRREILKFGAVGLVAYVVDVGVFNLLRYGGGTGLLHAKPLTAKIVSTVLAMLVAWLGNRYWTYRDQRRDKVHHELILFVGANLIGMAIAVVCLWFSHYVLHQTSPLADNLSANGVGLALGTAFRFWAYRTWVFRDDPDLWPARSGRTEGLSALTGLGDEQGEGRWAGGDEVETPADGLGEVPRESQAQPHARPPAGAHRPLEDVGRERRVDPVALVGHLDDDARA